jgi:hypothetical protein
MFHQADPVLQVITILLSSAVMIVTVMALLLRSSGAHGGLAASHRLRLNAASAALRA